MNRILLLLVMMASVVACAPLPVVREAADGNASSGSSSPANEETDASPGPATVLLQQSRSQRDAGRYGEAAASLERAVRIEPANPYLWLELAEVYLAAGDAGQAEAHARKAFSLAGSDSDAESAAQRILDVIAGS